MLIKYQNIVIKFNLIYIPIFIGACRIHVREGRFIYYIKWVLKHLVNNSSCVRNPILH